MQVTVLFSASRVDVGAAEQRRLLSASRLRCVDDQRRWSGPFKIFFKPNTSFMCSFPFLQPQEATGEEAIGGEEDVFSGSR